MEGARSATIQVPRVLQRGKWLNLGLKVLLLVLLAAAVPLADTLDRFEGKGMVGRAGLFWIAPLLMPAAWYALGRRTAYPHLPDALIVAPFIVDVSGNYLDLYARVDHFDIAAHFVNWIMLCTGFGALLLAVPLSRLTVGALVIGFGAFAKVVWELGEYAGLLLGVGGLGLDYHNTMQDMAAGMLGAFIAMAIVVRLLWPRAR